MQIRVASSDDKVRFLSSAAAYTHAPSAVGVEETHMAWIFLAGERVYKLKKSVQYPFLDFSTIDRREAICREEVRLNRRLAPDIYLGVVPLVQTADGRLRIDGPGTVVDWLVEMKRLPQERMLPALIAAGRVRRRDIEDLAELLCTFYDGAERPSLTGEAYCAHFAEELQRSAEVLSRGEFALSRTDLARVLEGIERFLTAKRSLLSARAETQRIVEGHGDLKPEHICLLHPPVIIDCLEFNRRLRLIDPFDELSYLALECRRLGAEWIGTALLRRASERLADSPCADLLLFYTGYRCTLRARLALAHLLEPAPRERDKWIPLARDYLEIAVQAIGALDGSPS